MKIFAFLFLTFYFLNLNAAVVPKSNSLYFIENKGQMIYQDGTLADDIRYSLISGDMRIDIKSNSIHYTLYQKTYNDTNAASLCPLQRGKSARVQLASLASYRVDVLLEGSNIGSEITPSGKLDYYENYYVTGCGVDGVTKVSVFSSLLIKNIYPGIDWKIYIEGDQFKYDFIVHPGADPSKIKLKYFGADSIIKDQDGNIEVHTPYGSFTENKPYSYDATTKKEIPSEYKIDDNTLSFKMGAHSGTCIIDPVIQWCTYYGGSVEDWINMTEVDEDNNVIMVGSTSSLNNIATTGAYQYTYSGGEYDGLIVYFDSKGVRKWSTYYGGDRTDQFSSVQYYHEEFILAGTTSSLSDISSPGTYQTNYGGGASDCMLAKFNNQGLRLWSTYYGGPKEDGTYPGYPDAYLDIQVDGEGSIYMGATTGSQTGIATAGTHSASYNGGISDGFLTKFDNNGSRIWGTYLGGAADDFLYALDIDSEDNILICGDTKSVSGIATPGTYQNSLSGDFDSYIMKFNGDGVRSWGTYFGGTSFENGNNVKVDRENNIYLIGSTGSKQSISTTGAFQTSFGGNSDGYLQKFSLDGKRIWGTYIGGSASEYFFGLDFDSDNNILFSGMTTLGFPKVVKGNAIQSAYGGGSFDCIIEKFNKDCKQIWGSYYGSTGNDRSWMLNIDLAGDIYMGGGTSSLTKISTPDAHQSQYGGGIDDIMLLKISDESLRNDEITEIANSGIYPNPTSGILQLTGYPDLDHLTIYVYNYSGTPVPAIIKNNSIDISAFIPGIYLIQIIDGKNKSGVTKVVKI